MFKELKPETSGRIRFCTNVQVLLRRKEIFTDGNPRKNPKVF